MLWKPVEQNWGVGVELNYVWQRDFDSPFGFGYYDYDVVTGHASLYWDTGWYGIEAQLAAGRYLAGDWGGTLFLSRQFANGWAVGAFATLTDVVDRGLRRGQLRQGRAADHPAALGDAVRDPPDDRRRPAVAGERRRRLAQHRQPALSDVRDLDREPARAQLGGLLAMMRTLALLALAALCGCGSGGTDPIVRAAMDEFGGIWGRRGEQPAGAPARPITRADITAADVAAIWARLESDPSPTLMYALAQNGGYVTYISPLRQSITLHGTQITATRGLGTDLLSAWSSRPDPLAQAIPPGSWPASVERGYEFPADGPHGELQTFRCTFERGALTEMTILQVRHRGVEISETCTGPSGSFENLHFADARTGFVWRSLQWVGPSMDLVDMQVLEPYTGG